MVRRDGPQEMLGEEEMKGVGMGNEGFRMLWTRDQPGDDFSPFTWLYRQRDPGRATGASRGEQRARGWLSCWGPSASPLLFIFRRMRRNFAWALAYPGDPLGGEVAVARVAGMKHCSYLRWCLLV